jgi:hypothetical protein
MLALKSPFWSHRIDPVAESLAMLIDGFMLDRGFQLLESELSRSKTLGD